MNGYTMDLIKIDAFNTNLHGCKILCQGPFHKYPPIMDSIQKLREPFKKKLLLTQNTFSLNKYLHLQYDSTFQVKDAQDWTLILTYITYAPKPLLIVSEDLVIPDGLWNKLNKSITFVNMTSSYVAVKPYDTIFFSDESIHTDYVLKTLQSVYKATYSQKEHKEISQELRVAGAGICWTRHEENQNGNIYWYDPVVNQGDSLSNKQMSELFNWLSQQFKET